MQKNSDWPACFESSNVLSLKKTFLFKKGIKASKKQSKYFYVEIFLDYFTLVRFSDRLLSLSLSMCVCVCVCVCTNIHAYAHRPSEGRYWAYGCDQHKACFLRCRTFQHCDAGNTYWREPILTETKCRVHPRVPRPSHRNHMFSSYTLWGLLIVTVCMTGNGHIELFKVTSYNFQPSMQAKTPILRCRPEYHLLPNLNITLFCSHFD